MLNNCQCLLYCIPPGSMEGNPILKLVAHTMCSQKRTTQIRPEKYFINNHSGKEVVRD